MSPYSCPRLEGGADGVYGGGGDDETEVIVQVETPDGQRWQGAAVTGGAPVAAVTIE